MDQGSVIKKTPLDSCMDEETVLKIVNNEVTHWDMKRTNVKGNSLLQICAKKDFRKCVENILFSCHDEETTRQLLLHTQSYTHAPFNAEC